MAIINSISSNNCIFQGNTLQTCGFHESIAHSLVSLESDFQVYDAAKLYSKYGEIQTPSNLLKSLWKQVEELHISLYPNLGKNEFGYGEIQSLSTCVYGLFSELDRVCISPYFKYSFAMRVLKGAKPIRNSGYMWLKGLIWNWSQEFLHKFLFESIY